MCKITWQHKPLKREGFYFYDDESQSFWESIWWNIKLQMLDEPLMESILDLISSVVDLIESTQCPGFPSLQKGWWTLILANFFSYVHLTTNLQVLHWIHVFWCERQMWVLTTQRWSIPYLLQPSPRPSLVLLFPESQESRLLWAFG